MGSLVVVVMGVSGAGKTTIGKLLADRLGVPFIEGDDHHPRANVAKMASGVPLEDADRWPWLDRLNQLLKENSRAVLACSALKAIYRERLLAGVDNARIVHLHGDKALIAGRLADRKHRYMPASLLDSQFDILESPLQAISCDVAHEPESCVAQILRQLSRP